MSQLNLSDLMQKPFVTLNELCVIVGCSHPRLSQLVHEGVIKKMGTRKFLIHRESAIKAIEKHIAEGA